MSKENHPEIRAVIDAYFEGRGDGAKLAELTDHFADCDRCRGYFARRQLLASMDPKGLSAKDRIGQSLGFAPPTPKRSFAPLMGLASALAAAALLVVVIPSENGTGPDDGFAARGGAPLAEDAPPVDVFRITPSGPRPAKDQISRGDELAFTYRNPTGRERLMIYGVDDTGAVYWYHPAWTDPGANPTAIAVASGNDVVELKEAIAHDLTGHTLKVYALFTDAPLTVREVEATVAQQGTHPDAVLAGAFNVVP